MKLKPKRKKVTYQCPICGKPSIDCAKVSCPECELEGNGPDYSCKHDNGPDWCDHTKGSQITFLTQQITEKEMENLHLSRIIMLLGPTEKQVLQEYDLVLIPKSED